MSLQRCKKQGRIVSTCAAEIVDTNEKVCASAYSLHMTRQPEQVLPTHRRTVLKPEEATPGLFPIQGSLHEKPFFSGSGVSVKYPAGQDHTPGPTTAWMRTVPLLNTEAPSPFQRLCPLADCGNAFGRNAEPADFNFMNPDLSIHCHRDPVGDWLGTDVASYWESDGIGMSDAHMFDQHGSIARAVQTLLIMPTTDTSNS